MFLYLILLEGTYGKVICLHSKKEGTHFLCIIIIIVFILCYNSISLVAVNNIFMPESVCVSNSNNKCFSENVQRFTSYQPFHLNIHWSTQRKRARCKTGSMSSVNSQE